MYKKLLFGLITISVLTIPLWAEMTLTPETSPWEHTGSELTTSVTIVPGSSPITYSASTIFDRELEQFGYVPRFMPGIVSFDKNNRPYIFSAIHSTNKFNGNQSAFEPGFHTQSAYIQTIDPNSGDWIAYDVEGIIRELFKMTPWIDPDILAGHNYKDALKFNNDNNYFFTLYESGRAGKTLFYSLDELTTIDEIYIRHAYTGRLEHFDSFTNSERYMPIMSYCNSGGAVGLVDLTQDVSGEPVIQYIADKQDKLQTMTIEVSPDEGQFSPDHSGYLNNTVTVGDSVHCFWLDSQDQTDPNYTKQYHSSYNRATNQVSSPSLLGSTHGYWPGGADPADTHNGPTITVDRDKVLHVVLGGHGSQAKYTYSEDNGRTWSTPVNLPGNNAYNTYPTLITDRDNTLHLVYRATLPDGSYTLSYSRKKQGQSWQDMGNLIEPQRNGYNVYYHTLTVDRLGRLFLTYWYRAQNLTSAEITEYENKWPDEPSPAEDDENAISHNPVIIMSDDGGDSWEIVTTQDFIDGFIDDTIPSAYYTLDSYGSQTDMTGNGHNLDTVSGQPGVLSGVSDNAASFDGIDDGYSGVFDQNDLLVDGAFTLTGWFKADSVPSAKSNLVDGQNSSSGFGLYVENGKWTGYTYADGVSESISSSSSVPSGQWSHIAFTYYPDGEADSSGTYTGTMKLYVDGSLETTLTGKEYSPSDANQLTLGMSASGDGYFACGIDDLAIFKGAMPAEKISELANQEFSPFNVSRELLYKSDFNEDGKVNLDDAKNTFDSWLE